MPKSKRINFSVNNTFKSKTAKYKVVVYPNKLEQTNIVFNSSLHPLMLLTASVDIFQIKIFFGSCCPDNGSKLRPCVRENTRQFLRDWPLVHDIVQPWDRQLSDPFLFCTSDSHSQAGSTTQTHGEERIGLIQSTVVHTKGG